MVQPSAPRFEHRTEPGPVLGLGTPTPRLSWTVTRAEQGWRQTAYEVQVAGEVFTVRSAEQVLVPWPARPLRSRERAEVKVRVAYGDHWSPWSEAATVEAGLLDAADWTARFISPVDPGERAPVRFTPARVDDSGPRPRGC